MMLSQIADCLIVAVSCFVIHITLYKILGGKKRTLAGCIFLGTFQSVAYYLVCYSPTVAELLTLDTRMMLKTLFMIPIFWVFGLLFCGSSLPKRLQTVTIVLVGIFVAEAFMTLMYTAVLDVSVVEIRDSDTYLKAVTSLLDGILYFIACITTYFICKRQKLKIPTKLILLISLLLFALIFMITLIIASTANNDNFLTNFTIAFSTVVIICLIFIVCNFMVKFNEQELLKEKLFWSENLQKAELNYYETIKQKSEDLRQMRHDFKDNLHVVNSLIQKNTKESLSTASDILETLDQKLEASKIPYFTDNLIVNTLLGIKYEEYRDYNIFWDIKLDLPDSIEKIEAIDMNCLFVNLINNALEACCKVESDKRFIKLRAVVKSGHLIVKVENSFSDLQKNEEGELITTKKDKGDHGIGLMLIENIVKKYKGFYESEIDESVFKTSVVLEI